MPNSKHFCFHFLHFIYWLLLLMRRVRECVQEYEQLKHLEIIYNLLLCDPTTYLLHKYTKSQLFSPSEKVQYIECDQGGSEYKKQYLYLLISTLTLPGLFGID